MPSDVELLDGWVNGDEAAGRALVSRYYSSVFRFFRAKADNDVDDLAQETFLALVRNRGQYRGEAAFRSYVFGTARNVLLVHLRRRRRKDDPIDFGSHSVVDLGVSPSAALDDKGEKRLLLEGLKRIPIDDQIVIELFHWEGMTAIELGEVLGLTEPAVRSRLHRARKRLGEAIRGIATSPRVLESTMSNLEAWAKRRVDWSIHPRREWIRWGAATTRERA